MKTTTLIALIATAALSACTWETYSGDDAKNTQRAQAFTTPTVPLRKTRITTAPAPSRTPFCQARANNPHPVFRLPNATQRQPETPFKHPIASANYPTESPS